MYKKLGFFVMTCLALLLAGGCEGIGSNCRECSAEGMRKITVRLGGEASIGTRVVDVTDYDETMVNSCRLFVFSQEGVQIDQWSAADGNFEFYLTDGIYEFIAVVNYDGELPDKKATREDLLAFRVPIEKSSLGNFVMVGRLREHVIEADEKITIEVRRLVSKVSFMIESAFEDYMASYDFTIDGIYMTNIVGDVNLGVTDSVLVDTRKWYDQMNYDASVAQECPWPEEMYYGSFRKKLEPGEQAVSGHVFYIYPNASGDNHDKEVFSPRCTRFVVAAKLNGRRTYYPVTLYDKETHVGVLQNKHYHVVVTVKNWGYDHPEDDPSEYGAMEVSFKVMDWGDGGWQQKVF